VEFLGLPIETILIIVAIAKIWGGLFYLFNKIFFLFSEIAVDEEKERKWDIRAWSVYLVGLWGWLIYFVSENNWALFGVETGGSVLMAIGLYYAIKRYKEDPSKKYLWIARGATAAGIIASLWIFEGVTTINQILEFLVCLGFLMGTSLLRKKNVNGYLWFLLMNGSNAGLMGVQGAYELMAQQIISFFIVFSAYIIRKRREKE